MRQLARDKSDAPRLRQEARFRRAVLGLSLLVLTASLIIWGPRVDRFTAQEAFDLPSSMALALAAHSGAAPIDGEIRRWQERIRTAAKPGPYLERLGWAFVAKARQTGDAGYYRLAEQCALAMLERSQEEAAAWLLRGHVLHGLHRFDEAELLARALVTKRGLAFDYGLLGDVRFDQGAVADAALAYQRMMDLRPDALAYARAAELRFVTGDVDGAAAAATVAARASSPRSQAFPWIWSRLAEFQLQQADFAGAHASADFALRAWPESADAFRIQGRILLAEGRAAEAIEPLSQSARLAPRVDVLWLLVEAHRALRQADEADIVERRLLELGSGIDPRGFALYLASVGRDLDEALLLAEREALARQDIYTFEVLAWSQAATGRIREAQKSIQRALSQRTVDARLFYHAGQIAARAGDADESSKWFTKARPLIHMLLPSQREQLKRHFSTLDGREPRP